MKTRMIPGLNMLVFNDINKPRRKFHLRYIICSAPQVARGPCDTVERREGESEGGRERGESCVPLFLGMLESQWLERFIKAQLVTAADVAVLKEKKN